MKPKEPITQIFNLVLVFPLKNVARYHQIEFSLNFPSIMLLYFRVGVFEYLYGKNHIFRLKNN